MRRWIAGLLATLTLAGVVFAASAAVAPPAAADDPWNDDYEEHLRLLEEENGVTRKQCDDDWLGLRVSQCAQINRYRNYPSVVADGYAYTSEDALENSRRFSVRQGTAPAPVQVLGSGAAAASTTAAGMTSAQASAYVTGMTALTGAGLLSVIGKPWERWFVDEATTDLAIVSGAEPGWENGANSLQFGGLNLEFRLLNPDVFYGTTGPVQIEVTDSTGFLQGAANESQLQNRLNQQIGSQGLWVTIPGGGTRNIANWSLWWNNGSPSSTAVFTRNVSNLQHVEVDDANAVLLRWYPLGHELRPAELPSGMHGTLTTTLECTSAEGSQDIVFTDVYSGGFEMDVPAKECPQGHVLTGGRADWTTDQGTQEVWTYDAPDEIKNIPVEFDHCLTGADCGLGLWRILSDGEVESCGALAIGCQNWWSSGAKHDNYQCRAGGSVVDLGYCAHLRQPGQISPVTGVDVTPDGRVIPQPRTVSTDPDDFAHLVRVPVTVPDPEPGPGPGPQPPPPPPPPAPMPDPDVEQETRECWPSGWGVFNPFEWVYRPVQCALVWAFVPNRQVDTSALLDAFDASVIGYLVAYLPRIEGAFDGLGQYSQECGVIASTEMSHLGGGQLEITTCSPIVDAIRPFMHIALSVLALGSAVLFSINAVMAAFGLAGVLSTAGTDDKKVEK